MSWLLDTDVLSQQSKQNIIDTLQSLPTRSTLHLKPSLLDEVIEQVNQQA